LSNLIGLELAKASISARRFSSMSLLAFRSRVGLGSKVGSCSSRLGEEAGEDWLDDGAEDKLGTVGHWESHPEDEDELEDVVEWEPVDSIDKTFEHIEECIHDPVCQPLSIVDLACAEKRIQGVVSRDDEACKVDEELSTDIEKDKEEVDSDEAEECVDLRDTGLLLETVERRVLGKFLINLGNLMGGFVLERHFDDD